ncbi:DNA polymerase III, delta subunit, partial [human gut metagenome]
SSDLELLSAVDQLVADVEGTITVEAVNTYYAAAAGNVAKAVTALRHAIATRPWYFTAGSKIKPIIEIAIITNKIPPGTRHFSRPKMTARPSKL